MLAGLCRVLQELLVVVLEVAVAVAVVAGLVATAMLVLLL